MPVGTLKVGANGGARTGQSEIIHLEATSARKEGLFPGIIMYENTISRSRKKRRKAIKRVRTQHRGELNRVARATAVEGDMNRAR